MAWRAENNYGRRPATNLIEKLVQGCFPAGIRNVGYEFRIAEACNGAIREPLLLLVSFVCNNSPIPMSFYRLFCVYTMIVIYDSKNMDLCVYIITCY